MPDRLVIVVPYSEEHATRNRIVDLAARGWEDSIRLVGGPNQRGRGDSARAESRRILDIVDNFDADSLIVAKEICCDTKSIQGRFGLDLRRPSVGLLRERILKQELQRMELSWRRILQNRLAFWNSAKCDVDEWLRQFEHLNAYWVGETLLRQLDVVGPNEVVQAFRMPPQAMVGQNHVFAVISESDPASSSNRIGAMLAQLYQRPHVGEFVAALIGSEPGSHLVVCEDALWTGTELRSLLSRLVAGSDLEKALRGKRITFRHCVVTDFGLWIVRHFISFWKLDNVELLLDHNQRFIRVLAEDVSDAEIRSKWYMTPIDFEDWLTAHVRPIAFRDVSLWRSRQEDAQRICSEIGRQLIDKYVVDGAKRGVSRFRMGLRSVAQASAG